MLTKSYVTVYGLYVITSWEDLPLSSHPQHELPVWPSTLYCNQWVTQFIACQPQQWKLICCKTKPASRCRQAETIYILSYIWGCLCLFVCVCMCVCISVVLNCLQRNWRKLDSFQLFGSRKDYPSVNGKWIYFQWSIHPLSTDAKIIRASNALGLGY